MEGREGRRVKGSRWRKGIRGNDGIPVLPTSVLVDSNRDLLLYIGSSIVVM